MDDLTSRSHTERCRNFSISSWLRRVLCAGLLVGLGAPAAAGNRLCSERSGIRELVACVATHMPEGGSGAYVPPLPAERAAWQTVVREMLTGSCQPALPPELDQHYERRWLGGRTGLCVLVETLDANGDGLVDRGWGTLAVASHPRRELHIQVPHPLYDIDTEHQGAAVFEAIGGRSFLMAGAERNANYVLSSCQSAYWEADPAHNTETLFHTAMEVIAEELDARDGVVIQLHGMGAQSCSGVDVFATWGGSWAPRAGSRLMLLATALATLRPEWRVRVPGQSPPCDLSGGSNVQGRLLNGVDPLLVCSRAASLPGERFIHVEQKRGCRETPAWVTALAQVWPAVPGPAVRRRLRAVSRQPGSRAAGSCDAFGRT